MGNANLKLFGIPFVFFLLVVLFLIFGANGASIAVNFSSPGNAESWETSSSLINAFISIPTIVGITFFILFISTFSISFYYLQNKS